MSESPANPPSSGASVTLQLSAADVERLDARIAAQPEPRPARSVAARRLLAEALSKATVTAPPAISDEAAVPELPEGAAEPYDGAPV